MITPYGAVEIERDGRTYSGNWRTEKGMISVRLEGVPTKTTQLGGSAETPEALAKIMLGELVSEFLSTEGQ